jgi:hypothetical protein
MLLGKYAMRFSLGLIIGLLLTFISHTAKSSTPGLVIASDAIQPHVAIDSDGNIYVVFIHKGNICVAVSTDGGKAFGESTIAIDVKGRARGGRQRGPRIGVDAKKNLAVTAPVTFDDAEYKKRYPTAELYLVTSSDGGLTWSTPRQVNEVSKKAPEGLHWTAVAPTGEVHIAWLDIRSRRAHGQDIYYTKVTKGEVGENIKVASTVCECCAPGLAIDGDGNPFLAFREGGDKPSREIYAIRSVDKGNSFGKAIQINRRESRESG